MEEKKELLTMNHISKHFSAAVIALDDVEFRLNRGEIHALLGGERRRQIHSDQGFDRGRGADCRDGILRGQ